MMKINFFKYNSFLVAIYCFNNTFLRIFQIFNLNVNYSKYLLLFFFSFIIFEIKNLNFKFLKYILIISLIILLNILFSKVGIEEKVIAMNNIYITGMSATIVGSLKIKRRFIEKYLKYMSYLNIVVYSYIFFFNKILYYRQINYMVFGYALLQSSIFLLYIIYKNKKIVSKDLIFILYSLGMIILFGSRLTAIILIFSILVFYWYYEKNKIKKLMAYYLVLIINLLVYINLKELLIYISNYFSYLNRDITGIRRLIESLELEKIGGDITSGRNDIYVEAINIIKKNPLGIGVLGYLSEVESNFLELGYYPHNIFIEIGMHWGILGLLIFMTVILRIGYKIVKLKNDDYKFFLITLILLNIKLLLSDTYISYNIFWLFWAVYFNKSYRYN